MSAQATVYMFHLIIYILIIITFNKARAKYAGGKIGEMINLIIVTVILLFCSDYAQVFDGIISDNIIFSVQAIFRAAGLSFLAFGGIRISSD